ncbi:MAG TPA: beta-ketoacyl synthase N-terminal-like domain-containing protein, partial [Actinoplanes sp.]|nr:beta-ketoacyl synthase N-terminal-like domain-containing protein [Actinoplanes sp.]
MPEAVIVATARSPIGRAHKGSLKDLRPDDLATRIVDAALSKVPQLDRTLIEDLYLGCGLPGGEQGFNMARVVATQLGLDGLPGATVTRYCSSSLQTTRMAFHAIKAGEGDIFVSAGVETVSRFARGSSDGLPSAAQDLVGGPWTNPAFADAQTRTVNSAKTGTTWHDPRADGLAPDIYIGMGYTAENLAQIKNVSREEMDEFGVRSQNLAE